jgi:hypothetical protein
MTSRNAYGRLSGFVYQNSTMISVRFGDSMRYGWELTASYSERALVDMSSLVLHR